MSEKYKSRNAVRRILWQWANTTRTIERLEAERAYFRSMADEAHCMLKAQNLSGMPGSGRISDLSDVMEQIEKSAEMYARQCERINAEIADALRLRNAIQDFVSRLTPVQEKVITYRYRDGHEWQFIAIKMNYDEKSVRRIETQVVDLIAKSLFVT